VSPLEQQARKDVNWYVELADGNWYKAQALAAKDSHTMGDLCHDTNCKAYVRYLRKAFLDMWPVG